MSRYRLFLTSGLAGLLLLAGSTVTPAAEIEAGLPSDTTAVLTVNLKQLLHAPVLKQHGLMILRDVCRSTESVREVLEGLGLDPFRDLDRLTVASIGVGEKADCVLILHGRFDTARFAVAAKALVKEHAERLVMHRDDKLKYISVVSTGKHGSIVLGAGANAKKGAVLNMQTKGCLLDMFANACLALVDKNTLVAATSEQLLKDTCKRIADKDATALNKRMRRLLSDLDSKQTLVFAVRQVQPALDKSETAEAPASSDSVFVPPPPLSLLPSDEEPDKSSGASIDDWLREHYGDATPLQESPSPKVKAAARPSALCEVSGSINLADDFTLRCAVRTQNVAEARQVMSSFKELRLRADGLMLLLAGSNKEYAFLKDIPRSFLAVRKGRVLLVEGRLSPETIGKLLETCSVKSH